MKSKFVTLSLDMMFSFNEVDTSLDVDLSLLHAHEFS